MAPHGAAQPDLGLDQAVVAALAGREDAAREMLGCLSGSAPLFLEAARRFGKAGLLPADVLTAVCERAGCVDVLESLREG
ncbi:MAG: hypothetical protein KY453_10835 [Gemmatimonadetes bacterium]|nr:hypothetical protein [Gemmatimonadota bacterium]